MKVKVINKSGNALPAYATEFAAGLDVRSNNTEPIELKPLGRAIVPTGLFLEIPAGYEVQVRPRSGLALKHCVTVLNTPGTIDAGYRGEVGVILINHGDAPFPVKRGDRIAQMVIQALPDVVLTPVSALNASSRGTGGFGSTGK